MAYEMKMTGGVVLTIEIIAVPFKVLSRTSTTEYLLRKNIYLNHAYQTKFWYLSRCHFYMDGGGGGGGLKVSFMREVAG